MKKQLLIILSIALSVFLFLDPIKKVDASVTIEEQFPQKKVWVFIDANLKDYQTLVTAVPKNAKTHIIEKGADGWKTIAAVLKDQNSIDAVHILGHGSVGNTILGRSSLNNSTINQYKNSLERIGSALTAEGDMLLYGCNVAAGGDGVDFIATLSELTGADVAASDDYTGSVNQRGDWQLEQSTGVIEATVLAPLDYDHNLATVQKLGDAISVDGVNTDTLVDPTLTAM